MQGLSEISEYNFPLLDWSEMSFSISVPRTFVRNQIHV